MELEKIYSYIDDSKEQMISLWKNLVEMESESRNIEGVKKIASHIDTYLGAMNYNTSKYIFEESGPSLVAYNKPQKLAPVALMGHMDTVHPKGSFGENNFRIEDGKVHGPGVYDMKGGIVIAILVMRALEYAGYKDRQIKLILSGDEEVAHSLSKGKGKEVYKEAAKDCCCAFNCESGAISGDVVTGRKGGGIYQFTVTGVPSHAGNKPFEGASAVIEASKKMIEIQEASNPDKVLYNCGLVKSEDPINVIPGQCKFQVSTRFMTKQAQEEGKKFLAQIAAKKYDDRTSTEMFEVAEFDAMEKTEKSDELFHLYAKAAKNLTGEEPKQLYVGGCSDASYVTGIGVPALCGVGVPGEYNHSKKEYALVDGVTLQAKKIVATILSLREDF